MMREGSYVRCIKLRTNQVNQIYLCNCVCVQFTGRTLLHSSSPTYLQGSGGSVSAFPYDDSCDTDMRNSPLRLGPPANGTSSSVFWTPSGLTYCWAIAHAADAECGQIAAGGSCCSQDLTAIYFEIGELEAMYVGTRKVQHALKP